MTSLYRIARIAHFQLLQPPLIAYCCPASTHLRTMAIEISNNRCATKAAESPVSTDLRQPLPLPEPPSDSEAAKLEMSSGSAVKLDHLGPMVVNRDGTLSRIANWEHMTEIERQNTLRILGKRNQLRMEALKGEETTQQ